jgi:hypothetical protein
VWFKYVGVGYGVFHSYSLAVVVILGVGNVGPLSSEGGKIEVEIEIVHNEPANWTGGHLSGHST